MPRYTLHPNTKTALWLVIGTLACVTAVVALINAPIFHYTDNTIVFMRHDGVDMEIFTVDANGQNEKQLTSNEYEDWAAVWTPDKSRIVFHSNRDGFYGIYIMDRDGSNVRLISPEGQHAQFPSVSPDGNFIVFEMWVSDNNWDIFVKAIDCGSMHRLTYSPAHEGGAVFSPDGSQIAYHSTMAAEAELGYDIYVMNLDGSGTQRMTHHPQTMDVWPQWSPDGSQIVFHSERSNNNSEIFIMNADGSNQQNLSNDPALDRVPRFSADGSQIVFRSERNGDSEIFIMNLDGSHPRQITDNDLRDMHPDS